MLIEIDFFHICHQNLCQATKGKLKLTFDKFNTEWSSNCKKKDYLYVSPVSFHSQPTSQLVLKNTRND